VLAETKVLGIIQTIPEVGVIEVFVCMRQPKSLY
jgi:hypothetical protein